MKYSSIFSVTSKSAITPSFIGRMAAMLPGVLPSMSLAAWPTASTRLVTRLTATIDGSNTTIPRARVYTSVVAVPRSTARSDEKSERRDASPICSYSTSTYTVLRSSDVLPAGSVARITIVF